MTEARPSDGIYDIGAYEFGSGGGNQGPVAIMSANPQSGYAPLGVSFSGTTSYDPDGSITAYAWDFGDTATATGPTAFHTYNKPGSYAAVLRVTDNAGATTSTTQTITVNPLPAPVLSGSVSGSTVKLDWTDSSNAASGWYVERKAQKGAWTQIAVVNMKTFSETVARGTWTYRVRAFNSAGTSNYSNEVSLRVS